MGDVKAWPTPESFNVSPWIHATRNWPFGLNVLLREVFLFWEFVRYDFSATLFPGLAFALAAWQATATHRDFPGFALASGRGFVYIALYIYIFDLSNQLMGIPEDQVSKPDRPLVRGLCSPGGALTRWVGASLLFLLAGWLWGVLLWAALWWLVGSWHNFLGAKHWLTKNLAIGVVGIVAELAPLWQLSTPLTAKVWTWIITMIIVNFLLMPMQDLRDTAGDRRVGRRTLHIAFGEPFVRRYLAIGFTLLPVVISLVLIFPGGVTWIRIFGSILLTALNLKTAWRVLHYRSPSEDHWTYLHFTYWYAFIHLFALDLL